MTAVNLTKQSLHERFGVLLGAKNQGSEAPDYGPKQVVSDMLVFNVESRPTHPSDPLDYGRQEIGRLTQCFNPF